MYAKVLTRRKLHDGGEWIDHCEDTDTIDTIEYAVAMLLEHECFYTAGYGFYYSKGILNSQSEEYNMISLCDTDIVKISDVNSLLHEILNHPAVTFERIRRELKFEGILEPLQYFDLHTEFTSEPEIKPEQALGYYETSIDVLNKKRKAEIEMSADPIGLPIFYGGETPWCELITHNLVVKLYYTFLSSRKGWYLDCYADTGASIEEERPDIARLLGGGNVNPNRQGRRF